MLRFVSCVLLCMSLNVFGKSIISCKRIPFYDINSIEIQIDKEIDKLTVYEFGEDGANLQTLSWSAVSSSLEGVSLSNWYGYTRTLYISENFDVKIVHADECSSGMSFLNCSVTDHE